MAFALLFSSLEGWAQESDSTSTDLQSLQEQFKGTTTQETSSTDKVTVKSRLSKNVVPAGSSVQAAVLLQIEEGWHINAHQPTLEYLVGTSVSVSEQSGIYAKKIRYPKSKTLEFEFAGDAMDVYEKTAPVILEIVVSDTLSPGRYTLKGKARVQACNNMACLGPANMQVSIPVEVVAKGSDAININNDLFQDIESP